MGDQRSSGSNAGAVILIALLVLALPCCGVALLGLGVFSFRAAAVPAAPPPPRPPMQAAPLIEDEMRLEPIRAMPAESTVPPAESLPQAVPGESPE